ncbi:DNA-binding protein HU-beta [Faunimonas pinastri]|uniref:DNA-binding protein HU-beta n=1 Tax=Faunimonas pinastri TaxID=1855383 RepID=A0A1H9PC62_9HYPH|nr:HU family DNA-binding protein [Faunimonas pinastri]SER45163.1 DNA-binding protein HU-beta [Faunimonas pinastri]
MNKGELAAAVAEKTGLGKSDASQAVDAVFDVISEGLKKGDEIRILGFGNFAISERAATTGRNPQTGEPMEIKASKQAKFKPGKGLKDAING